MAAKRRMKPSDDLISRMVAVHDADPQRLTEGEVVANAILFLNAGHEAVVNVSGNGMLALLRHPDQLRVVRDDPDAAAERDRGDDALRHAAAVLRALRPRGHGLRGVTTWPKGTRLCLYYAAANRDPAVFAEPDRFDVRRDPNPHLAFGLGRALLHRRAAGPAGARRGTGRAAASLPAIGAAHGAAPSSSRGTCSATSPSCGWGDGGT
jgi:cytochrome P450